MVCVQPRDCILTLSLVGVIHIIVLQRDPPPHRQIGNHVPRGVEGGAGGENSVRRACARIHAKMRSLYIVHLHVGYVQDYYTFSIAQDHLQQKNTTQPGKFHSLT